MAHPINPPHIIPLVEIVPAPWTDPDAVTRTRALMEAVGQSPISTTREVNGFIVNRLQGALLGEAFRLVQDGVCSVADVDAAIADGLGLRWSFIGPFETIDLNSRGTACPAIATCWVSCTMTWRQNRRTRGSGRLN